MPTLKARISGAWVDVGGSVTDRWNSAWGVVAVASVTTGVAGIGVTDTDVTGLSVTFTPVVGRRYVTTISWLGRTTSAGAATVVIATITDGANAVQQQRNLTFPLGTTDHNVLVQSVEASLPATSTVRKARVSTSVGTVAVLAGATYPAFIRVEDVGPVAGAVAIPSPTPAWTAATLLNGWVNVGGIHQVAQYRVVGDMVQLRGRISGGTIGSPIFTLPAGYRPPAVTTLSTATIASGNWAFGIVEVALTGDLSAFAPATNAGVILNGLSFSVT